MLDAGVRAPRPPSRRSEPANHQLHLGRAFGIYPFSQGLPGSMNMAFTQANAYSSSGSGTTQTWFPSRSLNLRGS